MKNQTLSMEQMKHLKDLGVNTSKASMIYQTYKDITDEWIKGGKLTSGHFKIDEESKPITRLDIRSGEERLYDDMSDCSNYSCCEIIPSFTLQDMLEMMPSDVRLCKSILVKYNEYWICNIIDRDDIKVNADGSTSLEAVYKMLCWLAENNYLNKEQ